MSDCEINCSKCPELRNNTDKKNHCLVFATKPENYCPIKIQRVKTKTN